MIDAGVFKCHSYVRGELAWCYARFQLINAR